MAIPRTTEHVKIVAVNRRATHDYASTIGSNRTGPSPEQSNRSRRTRQSPGVCAHFGSEAWLTNVHVLSPTYRPGNQAATRATSRPQASLLHRDQISELIRKVRQRVHDHPAATLSQTRSDQVRLWAESTRKRRFDKRESIAKREAQRDIERGLGRNR